jgi:hypothetical protein
MLAEQPADIDALERALDLAVELAIRQRQHRRLDQRRADLGLLRRRRHEGLEPRPQQLEALAQAALERAHIVIEGPAPAPGVERRQQALLQGHRRRAGGEARLLGRQLLDQVGARALDVAGAEVGPHLALEVIEALGVQEFADRPRELGREHSRRRREAERRAQAGDALGAAVPGRAQVAAVEVGPEQAGQRARGRRDPQQAGGGPQRQQLLEDRRRVGVVQAALVALVVALGGEAAHQLEQAAGLALGPVQACEVEALLAGLGRRQHRRREVLAAVHLRGLGDDLLVPVGAGLVELGVVDRLEEVGAAEVQRHLVAAGQQRHVEHLGVDVEAEGPELDDRGAAVEELEAVAQGPERVLTGARDLRRDLVGLDRGAEAHQALDQLLGLEHHRVGREVGVQLLGRLEGLGPAVDALDDPLGRDHQRLHPRLPLVEQRLLAGGEGVVHLLALGRQLADELVELAEAPGQLLELDQQLGQLLVALLRRVGLGQRRRDRLREQLELGGELGLALARQQLLAHALIGRADPAVVGEHRRDVLEDLRARDRITDLQPADDLGEHVEAVAQRRDLLLDRLQLRGVVELLHAREDPVEAGGDRQQRVALDQEFDAGLADAVELVDQLLLERVEGREVDRADLARGDDRAALVSQRRQGVHVLLDVLPVAGAQGLDQRGLAGLRLREGLAGALADLHDLLELVDDELAGLADRPQRAGQVADLRVADPIIIVGDLGGLGDQVLVGLAAGVLILDQADHAQRLRDAAHQLGVADLGQVRAVGRGRGGVLGRRERGAPDLHRVDPGRLLALHAEDDQAAVGKRL